MKRTSIGNTLRDIANESAVNKAEAHSLKLIAKEYDTLKASHAKLVEYARHHKDCHIDMHIPMSDDTESCTCGFQQALAEAEKI